MKDTQLTYILLIIASILLIANGILHLNVRYQ